MNKINLLGIFFLVCFGFACDQKSVLIASNLGEETLVLHPIIVTPFDLLMESGDRYFELTIDGAKLPHQYDDLNDNGFWDELVFQLDLDPQEEVKIDLNPIAQPQSFQMQTGVHLGVSADRNDVFTPVSKNTMPSDHVAQSKPYLYQFEGPGWENNMIGFRSYFDARNGKDIFGKRTEKIILPEVGKEENYHSLQPWGMDILKVGNSLGAGALAIKKSDTLIRLSEVQEQSFSIIAKGPVRSVISLNYKGWNTTSELLNLTEQIEIWADKPYYKSKIHIEQKSTDTLSTGIVNLHGLEVKQLDYLNMKAVYTHGIQSENKDKLGLALIVSNEVFAGHRSVGAKSSGIGNTEVVYLNRSQKDPEFLFLAGWELTNPDYGSESFFREILKQATIELSDPIAITTNVEKAH